MFRENAMSADNQQGRVRRLLDPWYVSGFVDGEGSFHIAISKDQTMKTGIKIIPEFHVSQRVTSKLVLDALVDFFECGYVKPNHRTNPKDVTMVYVVRDRNDLLTKIIPFFERYPLYTEKAKDFTIFAEVVKMMQFNEHLQIDGVQRIISLAYSMNGSGRYRKRPQQILENPQRLHVKVQ